MEPAPDFSQTEERSDPAIGDDSRRSSLELRRELAEAVESIAATAMPFGKYGPKTFPPDGMPLYDLPVEYLQWFAGKGFPTGRLGRLMQIVYQLKCEGSDSIFDHIRNANGGRGQSGKSRRRSIQFE